MITANTAPPAIPSNTDFNAVKAPVAVIAPASRPANLRIVVPNPLMKSPNVSPSLAILNAIKAPVAPPIAVTHLPSIYSTTFVTLINKSVKPCVPTFKASLLRIV